MKCKGIKSNGKKCNTNAMDNGYCYFHNPDITEEQKKATVSKGGKANKIIEINENYPVQKFNNIKDVSIFLGLLINETMAGKMDIRLATGLTYISNSLLKALELSDLQNRVDNVEEMLNEYKQRKNA